MIIAPVIFITVSTGIGGMNNMKTVGRVTGKAMIYFLTFSTIALIIGMIVANVVQPGVGMNIDPSTLGGTDIVADYVEKAKDSTITQFLMNILPTTLVSPLVGDNILQVLFVAVLFGIALASTGSKGEPILNILNQLAEPIFKIVSMLMKFAPIGAFGAMAFTIGKYGIGSVINLAFFWSRPFI